VPAEQLVEGPPDHEAHQLLGVERGGRLGRDVAPIAQHGDAVGYLEDFLEPVRDVHHADAVRGEIVDDAEELAGLAVCQGRGGLVHDNSPGIAHEGPGDGHDLAVRRREAFDWRRHVELDPQSIQPPPRLLLHHAPVETAPAGAGSLAADEQVLGDRKLGEEVELLGNHGDPGLLCVSRGGERCGLPVHLETTLVRLVEPVHDLHERALARAVLPYQSVHLPRPQLEVHVVHSHHAAEPFGDAREPEERRRLARRCLAPGVCRLLHTATNLLSSVAHSITTPSSRASISSENLPKASSHLAASSSG
jgi:hypothetical protein